MDEVPSRPYKFDDRARQVFLTVLGETGQIYTACKAAGISSSYVYQRKLIDEQLAAEIEEAMDCYRTAIEQEIRRRSMDGVVEYKYHQGMPVLDYELDEQGRPLLDDNQRPIVKGHAHVRKYSDTLLLAHARRHIDAYNEKKTVDMRVTGLEQLLHELKPSTGLPSESDDFSDYEPHSNMKH